MLKIEGLHVQCKQKTLLTVMDLEIEAGNCVGVLGANGAGKSTLLKSIGQDMRYQGKITWQQHNLAGCQTEKLAQKLVFMPQHSLLNFAFRVQEIIEMGFFMHALTKTEQQAVLTEVAAKFGLTALLQQNYLHLSGGEKQRVQAARIWAQISGSAQSKLILLDEPTSALDLKYQHIFLQQARQLSLQRHLVLIVLHDLHLAARYCNRVLLLHDGKPFRYGDTTDMMTADNIYALYGHHVEVYRHENGIRIR
ncbi:hypothetical protein A1D23_07465 [Chelonobacter oris]|uniref:ABC transporter domain-containing protein n=1 Tax=Chelonobacter oris TaxID=505317 RepID=A0A0A3BC32_9PAST|nr:ATP-binding cassette domain-containing protein [Chelonobacter oris]KGQ71099.1 hypothetical protein OA57_02385 [Chelonobacter oris]MDH2999928.1 hypothetical protein [Chelonobacter oris]